MPAPDIGVQVEGLDALRKALRQADKALAKDLGQAGRRAADIVARAAAARVPTRTGKARQSVRAVAVQGGGGVKGGGDKAPYYPWLDFGGAVGRNRSVKRPFLPQGRYIYPALNEHRDEVVRTYEQLLDDVLNAADLT